MSKKSRTGRAAVRHGDRRHRGRDDAAPLSPRTAGRRVPGSDG
ncbi:hypothetical protein K788_0001132 (plasmid) [Paraburkholderia caribensis MBA4]|uniref:Uncharacterized protein n=1 Tax=Paraburkholderia caribensis MBA4 TaxID=1323664 RepID=A0A0P0RNM6_9BURK|nr:hypothetical protein K788_0001132 [Paraburkholderia caribensis MBA4]